MKLLTRKEELVLLSIFQNEGKSHLIEILEYLSKNTKEKWLISTIHAVLDRLEKADYLNSEMGEPSSRRGGKAVKFYLLNKKSKKALEDIKAVNAVMWKGVLS
jgi:PadR family transcriptional regulator, regulatory protein PadR